MTLFGQLNTHFDSGLRKSILGKTRCIFIGYFFNNERKLFLFVCFVIFVVVVFS